MSKSTVIEVAGLGKKYRIGRGPKRAEGVVDAVKQVVLRPFRYLRSRLEAESEENTVWALNDVSFEVRHG